MEPQFLGEGVVPGEYFFGFYKTRNILLSNGANCTVLRAVVLTQYRRVTDGQTDGIAVASTALAMRALRRAVKTCGTLRSEPIDSYKLRDTTVTCIAPPEVDRGHISHDDDAVDLSTS